MKLQIYNTLTNKKEEFVPIHPGKVSMYVCGVTVYDDIHMGHARSMIVFDVAARYLKYLGYEVTHVTNFTDVDDKIIDRAKKEGVDALELSSRYIERYFKDAASLGVRPAALYPKASENMDEIIKMVQEIIDNGFGYVTEDGSVYFSVGKVKDYGRLTNQRLEDMESSGRVVLDEQKRDPKDFAIWKAAKEDEIAWDSPWGKGRPGWHIECSAMIRKHLGDTIDIHGGGNDLIFPHHENEILQTEAVTHAPLARYWMHNGMLQVKDEKMSKSLSNFFSVRDVSEKYNEQEIRFYFLNAHYRGPLTYSTEALDEAAAGLKRLWNGYRELQSYVKTATTHKDDDLADHLDNVKKEFLDNMNDDLNTRGAFGVIFQLIRDTNRSMADHTLDKDTGERILKLLEEFDSILGILPDDTEDPLDPVMDVIIYIRSELRKRKMFDLADTIRSKLADSGIVLEDSAEGGKWRKM